MSTPSLTEFLLARIRDDEEAAKDAGGGRWNEWGIDSGDAEHIARHDPARVLAECEAKRMLIGHLEDLEPQWRDYAEMGLSLLALLYADHADYREEWKP